MERSQYKSILRRTTGEIHMLTIEDVRRKSVPNLSYNERLEDIVSPSIRGRCPSIKGRFLNLVLNIIQQVDYDTIRPFSIANQSLLKKASSVVDTSEGFLKEEWLNVKTCDSKLGHIEYQESYISKLSKSIYDQIDIFTSINLS